MRAIVTYHSIDGSGSPISVDRTSFERQLDWYAASGASVVPLPELARGEGGPTAVALTFDDAFANFATDAMPGLVARGFPATVFVVTDHAGRDNQWGGRAAAGIPTLPLLDWQALGRLAEQGVTIGSHTRTHPHLTQVTGAELEDELAASADRIERELGRRPETFAYPYGALAAPVVAAARRHYRWAVTTDHRPVGEREDPLALPRLDAFYFRKAVAAGRWGTKAFERRVRIRRIARQVRSMAERVLGVGR